MCRAKTRIQMYLTVKSTAFSRKELAVSRTHNGCYVVLEDLVDEVVVVLDSFLVWGGRVGRG